MSLAHQIEIFSTTEFPVSTDGLAAEVCQLDDMEQFESLLSDKSEDLDAIKKLAKDHEAHLIAALTCQYLAALYGIEKLPAIVIDKQVVAYGLTSVASALSVFKEKGDEHA